MSCLLQLATLLSLSAPSNTAACAEFTLSSDDRATSVTFIKNELTISQGPRRLHGVFEEKNGVPVAVVLDGKKRRRVSIEPDGAVWFEGDEVGFVSIDEVNVDGVSFGLTIAYTGAPSSQPFTITVQQEGAPFVAGSAGTVGPACKAREVIAEAPAPNARVLRELRRRVALFLVALAVSPLK